MPSKYTPGEIAYIVESARWIREVKIIKVSGDLYTLRFTDAQGGVKLRESRLFKTRKEAEASTKTKYR